MWKALFQRLSCAGNSCTGPKHPNFKLACLPEGPTQNSAYGIRVFFIIKQAQAITSLHNKRQTKYCFGCVNYLVQLYGNYYVTRYRLDEPLHQKQKCHIPQAPGQRPLLQRTRLSQLQILLLHRLQDLKTNGSLRFTVTKSYLCCIGKIIVFFRSMTCQRGPNMQLQCGDGQI